MASLSIQISNRKKGKYATIIKTYIDPITRKRTSRSVKTYGYIDEELKKDPHYLDKIRKDLEELRKDVEQAEKLREEKERRIFPAISSQECQDAYRAAPRLIYGDATIRSLWEELELDKWFRKTRHNAKIFYDFDLAAFYMVACRILNPCSRLRMVKIAPQFFFDYQSNLKLDYLYDALGQIAKRKGTIIRYLTNKTGDLLQRDTTLVFYDVTTFYFESFEPDTLRARGMSKEHRTHETQVVLGLLIDANGVPIDYEVFRGNTAETKTLMKVVDNYRKTHEKGRVIVVADRGLNSKKNLSEIRLAGCDYIVAHTLQRLKKEKLDEIFKEEGWHLRCDKKTGEITWKYKSLIFEQAEQTKKKKAEEVKNKGGESGNDNKSDELPKPRLIVTWSANRAFNDLKEIDAKWQAAEALISSGKSAVNSSFRRGSRQFLKPQKNNSYELNKSLLDKKHQFAGYYGVVTSCQDLTDEQVYDHLRHLWKIEESFRVMKTYLQARPVYVRTEEHIRGHFLVCILALVLERILQQRAHEHGLEYSFDYLSELLTVPTISPIYNARNKEKLFLKTGLSMNSTAQDEEPTLTDMASDADKLMELFGIRKLKTIETMTDIRSRLKVHLPFT